MARRHRDVTLTSEVPFKSLRDRTPLLHHVTFHLCPAYISRDFLFLGLAREFRTSIHITRRKK